MKADKAPEKIYINPNLENRTWLIGKGDISFIEYVRKDAFLEKVCQYLESKVKIILCGDKIDTDKFIEDFKKYVEG